VNFDISNNGRGVKQEYARRQMMRLPDGAWMYTGWIGMPVVKTYNDFEKIAQGALMTT